MLSIQVQFTGAFIRMIASPCLSVTPLCHQNVKPLMTGWEIPLSRSQRFVSRSKVHDLLCCQLTAVKYSGESHTIRHRFKEVFFTPPQNWKVLSSNHPLPTPLYAQFPWAKLIDTGTIWEKFFFSPATSYFWKSFPLVPTGFIVKSTPGCVISIYCMTGPASRQDDINPALWLATWAGKMD